MRRRSNSVVGSDDDDSGARTTPHRPPAALAPADAATAPLRAPRGSTAPCERAVDARLVAEVSIRFERIGRKEEDSKQKRIERRARDSG